MKNVPLKTLARYRPAAAIGVFVLTGGLAVWAALQTNLPLTFAAWALAPILLAALVYIQLGAVAQAQLYEQTQAENERKLAALVESNTSLKAARQELAQQKMLAENLLAVARATGQQPVLEGTLQNTLDITAALTGTTHGSLFLLDANGIVTNHLLTSQDASASQAKRLIGHTLTEGLSGWVVRNRQITCVYDTQVDPHWTPLPGQTENVRSAIAVPFVCRGTVIGVLMLTHSMPNHFTEAHEKLLSSAVDQIVVALDNAKIFDTMMRMATRMGLLYALSSLVTNCDLATCLEQSLHSIQQATHWPALAILQPDLSSQNTTRLVARASVGSSLPDKLSTEDTLIHDAWLTHQTMEVENSAWGRLLVAPICSNEYALGALLVKGETAFTPDDIELISSTADTLASAIVNAELRRQVEELRQH
jgi:GAF domain-containing protein